MDHLCYVNLDCPNRRWSDEPPILRLFGQSKLMLPNFLMRITTGVIKERIPRQGGWCLWKTLSGQHKALPSRRGPDTIEEDHMS